MAVENRIFRFPILLVEHCQSPSESASDPTISERRFLSDCIYNYLTTERVHVSDLEEATLQMIGKLNEYKKRPDTDFTVMMYQCTHLLPDLSDQTMVNKRNAYDMTNNGWLEENGTLLAPRRPVATLKEGCVLAVLTAEPSLRSTQPSPIVQEVNDPPRQNHREQIAAAARDRLSQSTGATLAHRLQTQTTERIDAVYSGRPLELMGPPITIYHPVFANFLKCMQESRHFTPDELETAHNFVTHAAAYYRDESKRRGKLSPWMSKGVHPDFLTDAKVSNSAGKFHLDGAVFATRETHDGFKPLMSVQKLNSEIGAGDGDPSAQAEDVFVAYYSSNEARSLRDRSCCPALVVGMSGPILQVSGAVFADQLIVQNLGNPICVVPHLNTNGRLMLDDATYRVAQLFYALRRCLKELDDYYAELIQSMSRQSQGGVALSPALKPIQAAGISQSPPIISPHFTQYEDEQGKVVTLTYTRRLAIEYPEKTVFVAKAKTDTETRTVVVKFTPAYGKDAHELLARASPPQAPKLWFCKFVESIGMWVVVMDYVEGQEVMGVLQNRMHIASLKGAITTLHMNGFVFGDLRRPNVLLVADNVVLIDFDWCGKEGTVRYPSNIVLERGIWHDGVQRGGLVKKEHDGFHFHALTGVKLV